MITVRTSTVESFRLFHEPDSDLISVEEMDARLRGESTTSPRMALGTAFHEAVAGTYVGAVLFDESSLYKARVGLSGAQSEVCGSIVLDVDGTPVRVTGHADWLLGLDMVELKTSLKPIAPDKHADSMQWRCYVLIFNLWRVTYRLAQLEEDDDGTIYAKSIDDVVLYVYPKLRDDVISCLRDLLSFARARGLIEAMEEAA